ncbi:hypothetical protein BV25DRAFT_1916373 [Artomyces pyxidatus]|uniref:Uncharacterized protein n=1 Tax=Artomyces pyxidatus TaxID=48021 RepID=A0ACB8T1L7_9AGAM|nr:hypothetical protein BV25DRAFT_1916373 [Artomyces pyxidatus]
MAPTKRTPVLDLVAPNTKRTRASAAAISKTTVAASSKHSVPATSKMDIESQVVADVKHHNLVAIAASIEAEPNGGEQTDGGTTAVAHEIPIQIKSSCDNSESAKTAHIIQPDVDLEYRMDLDAATIRQAVVVSTNANSKSQPANSRNEIVITSSTPAAIVPVDVEAEGAKNESETTDSTQNKQQDIERLADKPRNEQEGPPHKAETTHNEQEVGSHTADNNHKEQGGPSQPGEPAQPVQESPSHTAVTVDKEHAVPTQTAKSTNTIPPSAPDGPQQAELPTPFLTPYEFNYAVHRDYTEDLIEVLPYILSHTNTVDHVYSASKIPSKLVWRNNRLSVPGSTLPIKIWIVGEIRACWFFDGDGLPQKRVTIRVTPMQDEGLEAVQNLIRKYTVPVSAAEDVVIHNVQSAAFSSNRVKGKTNSVGVKYQNTYDGRDKFSFNRADMEQIGAEYFNNGDTVIQEVTVGRYWTSSNPTATPVKKDVHRVTFELSSVTLLSDGVNPTSNDDAFN